MTNDWLTPDALVVPVDYATYCSAEVARDAALFLVDERDQFLANRDAGQFDDYPDPTATIGEAMLDGTRAPDSGRWSRRISASGSRTSSSDRRSSTGRAGWDSAACCRAEAALQGPSIHQQAAGQVERGAGDVAGVVRGEEDGRSGDVLGFGDVTERRLRPSSTRRPPAPVRS